MSFNRVRFAALLVASVGLTGCASSSSGDSWTKSAYCPWNWNPFGSSAAKTDATPSAVASNTQNKGVSKPSSSATPGISNGASSTSGLASSFTPSSSSPSSTGYQTASANGPMPNFNAGMYASNTQNGGSYPTTQYPTTSYPSTQYPATAQPNAYQMAANGQQNTVSNPFSNNTAGGFSGQPGTAVTPAASYGAPNNYGTPAQYVAPGSGYTAPTSQLPAYQAPTGGYPGSGFQNTGFQNNVPVTPIPGVQGSAPSQPSTPVYAPPQQQQSPAVPGNPGGLTSALTPNSTPQEIASLSQNVNTNGQIPMIPTENKAFNPGQTGFTPPNTMTTNSISNNTFRPGGTTSFPAANSVATVSYDNQGAGNVATANYNQPAGASNQNAAAGMNCANGVCTPPQKTDWTAGGTITPPASFNTPFQNAANTQSPGTPIFVK